MEKMTFEEFQRTRWVSVDAHEVAWEPCNTLYLGAVFAGEFKGVPVYEYVESKDGSVETFVGDLSMCERLAYQWYKEN